jgi:hypothetical protein
MEMLKSMKEALMAQAYSQISHLDKVDAKELGEVVDMIKDIEEAIYYCTITEAMNSKQEKNHVQYERDIDRDNGRMYYTPYYNMNGGNTSGGNSGVRNYSDMYYYPLDSVPHKDDREGRSPHYRKMYMETKEMHGDSSKKMADLEKYMMELSRDLTEMIQDASPEEK